MKLNICHLYPDLMNTYGDRGNIITLSKRAAWRGIEVVISPVSIEDSTNLSSFDLIFFGGGQDKEQKLVAKDLLELKKASFAEAIENGVVTLAICGGYQLLGTHYLTHTGEEIPGLGILDLYTKAGHKRLIGNALLETTQTYMGRTSIVGFENHSGKTYLGGKVQPLGKTIYGYGNNGEDHLEGCIYKNTFGTYLHGPLLPKNPHLADHLIYQALVRKYGQFDFLPLKDKLETEAHEVTIKYIRRA